MVLRGTGVLNVSKSMFVCRRETIHMVLPQACTLLTIHHANLAQAHYFVFDGGDLFLPAF